MRQFRRPTFSILCIWIFLIQTLFILLVFELPDNNNNNQSNHCVHGFVTIPAELAFAIITAAVKLKLIIVKILFALKTIGLIRNNRVLIRTAGRFKRSSSSASTFENQNNENNDHLLIGNSQNEILDAWAELESAAEQSLSFDLKYCQIGVIAPNSIPNPSIPTFNSVSKNKRRRRRRDLFYLGVSSFSSEDEEVEDDSIQKRSGSSEEDERIREENSDKNVVKQQSEEKEQDSMEDLLLYFDSREDDGSNQNDQSKEFSNGHGHESMITMDSSSQEFSSSEIVGDGNSYSQFISSVIGSMMQDMSGCQILEEGLKSLRKRSRNEK